MSELSQFIITLIPTGLIGGLVLLYLRGVKSDLQDYSQTFANRIDAQDQKIDKLNRTLSDCRIACKSDTVSKEDWVRSEGYARRELKEVTHSLNRIEGRLDVVDKLPEVCISVAREVANQVAKAGKDKSND